MCILKGSELMIPLTNGNIDKKLYGGLVITLGASMIFPEYIAPFFVFGLYIYFMKLFKTTGRNAKMGNFGKLFLIYMIYMMISAIWSNTHFYSVLISLLWMGCFLSYLLAANIINTQDKLKTAITAVNISAGIIGFIAVIEILTYNLSKYVEWFNFYFPNPLYYYINDSVFKLLPIEVINYKFSARASATFDNPLILATYLAVTTPFCAFGSVYFKHSRNRKISRACFIFAIGGLICTSSRSSYIAIAVGIAVMLVSNKKIFKKLFPFVILLAVTVPIGLGLRYKNTSVTEFFDSNNMRMEIWKDCIDMFIHNPILGLGAGTDNIHTLLRDTYGIINRTHAHNLFLEMIVEGGIIGGAFFISLIVILTKNIIKIFKLKDYKYRPYGVLYVSSLLSFSVMSVSEFTLQSPKELMIFFFLLGFIEATFRMATDNIQFAPDEIIRYEEIEDEALAEEAKETIKA